ncbi:MAG: MFS transporter, partial [Deltaproteobacteria bacterium]
MVSILFLGFSSGLPLALTFSTLSFWLKEEGLTNTAIGLFASVATPYSLKFVWAPVIDRASLPWLTRKLGRRRGWIVATQIALMVSLVGLGATHPAAAPMSTAVMALVVAFCSASQDIVIDAYRVEVLDESQYAAGAAAIVFGYRIGMLVSGAGALLLATFVGWLEVYATMAALVTVGLVTVLVSREPASGSDSQSSAGTGAPSSTLARAVRWVREAVVEPFLDFTRRRGWIVILAFVMLYKFGDALAGVMTNPFLLELGFSKAEIAAIVKTYGLAATLAGAAAGGSLLKATGMLRCLWICGLLQMLSNLMFAVQAVAGHSISTLTVTIGLENLAGGMGTAAFVAYLSSLCNVSYTATQYALLTSLMSAARTWLSSSGGWLADHMSWPEFFVLTTIAAVPGLALLWLLGRRGAAA